MKKTFFLLIIIISSYSFSFMLDPLNYITKSHLGLQVQFYPNGGKISIYAPFVYKIVSFDTYTNTMRFPEIVKGLAYIESGFNIHALSNVGAMGVAQFKESAGLDYGVYNAWNPKQSLIGADRMLRFYYQKYNDIYTSLVIYNIGEGNYKSGKFLEAGKSYANKVISAAKKISRKSSLYDRYVVYLQEGITKEGTVVSNLTEIGWIFDYLGIIYFDFSNSLILKENKYCSIETGIKSHFRINHFDSFVFGYNLVYNFKSENNEGKVSLGPIVGYSHFKPIGENFEILYDFSKGFDLGSFSFAVGYGKKNWRINIGYDNKLKNYYLNIIF